MRPAILGAALALLAACGGASPNVDTRGAGSSRQDTMWHDSSSKQDTYTPAREPSSSRKTGK